VTSKRNIVNDVDSLKPLEIKVAGVKYKKGKGWGFIDVV
jgi:hypothetical protein